MLAHDHTLIAKLLGVEAPWAVTEVLVSASSRTVTVGIEQPPRRARLFARRTSAPARRQLRWEHVGLAGWRCQVLLSVRDGEQLPVAPWAAVAAQPYTRGLQRTILDLLLSGATVEQLSVLLRLPFADLWRYKFRLDQGLGAGTAPPTAQVPVPPPDRRPASAAASVNAVMPGEDHPVWLALLLGRISVDVRMLGLRLLLAKLQRDAGHHGEVDLHRQAAAEIYRYFVRSHASLRRELGQLCAHAARLGATVARGASTAPPTQTSDLVSTSGAFELPKASDPLWLSLIEGECPIDVRLLGLRLLLSKLRTQLRTAADDDIRMVKLVELHRYFDRHQAALGHEIEQIRRWRDH